MANKSGSANVSEGSESPNKNDAEAKRRRITRACDRCHRSGIKCAPSRHPSTCEPCLTSENPCTYNRPIKRRGPTARKNENPDATEEQSQIGSQGLTEEDTWVYDEVAPQATLLQLSAAYYEIVYPIGPFFHFPTLIGNIMKFRHIHSRSFYASLMAMCALASARLRDGACTFKHLQAPSHDPSKKHPPSERFYHASIAAFPKDLVHATDFDYKRAKAILALLCLQYGDIGRLHTHLGDYLTLSAIDGFHNESKWPSCLNQIEIQERRRLFWHCYQFDVYSAVTFGGTIRHREAESQVLYPAEVYDDSDITEDRVTIRKDGPPILETATERLRVLRRQPVEADGYGRVTALCRRAAGPSGSDILDVISDLYVDLPDDFRKAEPISGDVSRDRIGFQAVNIIITMQTVRMVLAGSEDSSVSVKCAIAGSLLHSISNVPTAYLQAISVPTLHHLAGVGHLLGGVIQSPLSQWQYLQVRNILLSLADLLANLEKALHATAGIAPKLRAHVERIDQYMSKATAERARQKSAYPSNEGPSSGESNWHVPPSTSAEVYSESIRSEVPGFGINLGESAMDKRLAAPIILGPPDIVMGDPGSEEFRNETAEATYDRPASNPVVDAAQPFNATPGAEMGFVAGSSSGSDLNPVQLEGSLNDQVLLPDDLFTEWPFDLGQGQAFDFLSMLSTPEDPAALTSSNENIGGVGISGSGTATAIVPATWDDAETARALEMMSTDDTLRFLPR